MYSITQKGPLGKKIIPLSEGKTIILKGGRLIDGTGKDPIPNAVVIIEGERIKSVSRDGQVPIPVGEAVQTIDTTGQVILPGLIECHFHLRGGVTYDIYRTLWVPQIEVRSIRAALEAYEMLEAGITTIRDFGGFGKLGVKQCINDGLILGPRILEAIQGLSATGGPGDLENLPLDVVKQTKRMRFVDGAEACRLAVRVLVREGADLVKFFATGGAITYTAEAVAALGRSEFTRAEMEAIADEAHRKGLKVAAHAIGPRGVKEAVVAGADTIEHGHGDWADDKELMDLMVKREVTFVPTLSIAYLTATRGEEWHVLPVGVSKAKELLEQTKHTVKVAHAHGVKIAMGTDAELYVGKNSIELELLVEAGLTPMEAIVAGTRNAAFALGLHNDIGTVEAGKLADIVVWTKDPLQNIRILQDKESVARILKSREPLT